MRPWSRSDFICRSHRGRQSILLPRAKPRFECHVVRTSETAHLLVRGLNCVDEPLRCVTTPGVKRDIERCETRIDVEWSVVAAVGWTEGVYDVEQPSVRVGDPSVVVHR
jgi:hypothetical protein